MTRPTGSRGVEFESSCLRRAVLLAVAGAVPLGLAACGDPKPSASTTGEAMSTGDAPDSPTTTGASASSTSTAQATSTGPDATSTGPDATSTGMPGTSTSTTSPAGSTSTGDASSSTAGTSNADDGTSSTGAATTGGDTSDGSTGEPACSELDGGWEVWAGQFACEVPVCSGECLDVMVCVSLGGHASCDDIPPACIAAKLDAGRCNPEPQAAVLCGPDPGLVDLCCFMARFDPPPFGCPTPGRPFTVDGVARVAELQPRADWAQGPRPDVRALDARTREVLSALWAREAQAEHAAVGAFARFMLELLYMGAPVELIEIAHQTIGEELRHARRFLALANTYSGVTLGPGALRIAGSLDRSEDPIAIAVGAATEGCIAETAAYLQVRAARATATDPAVCAVLDEIAEQELRHGLLAWAYVAWAIRRDPAVREAVRAVFERAEEHLPDPAVVPDDVDTAALYAHGRPPPAALRAVARAALHGVILPCAEVLLRGADPVAAARRELAMTV